MEQCRLRFLGIARGGPLRRGLCCCAAAAVRYALLHGVRAAARLSRPRSREKPSERARSRFASAATWVSRFADAISGSGRLHSRVERDNSYISANSGRIRETRPLTRELIRMYN